MLSTTATVGKEWDFGPVFALLNNLQSPQPVASDVVRNGRPSLAPRAHTENPRSSVNDITSLGEFSRIWEYMGVDPNTTPPRSSRPLGHPRTDKIIKTENTHTVPSQERSSQGNEDTKRISVTLSGAVDYTSDGAIYVTPKLSSVKWRDEPEYIDNTESDHPASLESGDDPVTVDRSESTPMTKKQRKKVNRRARKEKKAEAQRQQQARAMSDVETEKASKRRTPARKASLHPVTPEPQAQSSQSRYNLRSSKPASGVSYGGTKETAPAQSPKSGKPAANGVGEASLHTLPHTPTAKPALIHTRSEPRPLPESNALPDAANFPKTPKPWPLVPSNVPVFDESPLARKAPPPPTVSLASHVYNVLENHDAPVAKSTRFPTAMTQARPQHPFVMRYGEDRHLHFLLELLRKFPNDGKWLLAPAQMSHHVSASNGGIHVFVDASNIFIGFKEYMRRLYGLPFGQQIKDVNISFDSLVLLMERRRPVAKRVLAGSYPHVPAFDLAKAVGYETNLLEQVYKDHLLSKNQKKQFYNTRRASFGSEANGNSSSTGGSGTGGGYASGEVTMPGMTSVITAGSASSNPRTPRGAQANGPLSPNFQKWVEQGVDELLHMKMLESLVDMETPSTMVLATGDAAVAEYSAGFLANVERALNKGWTVELLSWKEGINRAYLDSVFRRRWGEKFRVVELDGFAEDLIDS